MEKLRKLELGNDPSATNFTSNTGSFSSAEWVEVEKSDSNHVHAETINSISTAEFRSQIQKLHTRVTDVSLEILSNLMASLVPLI